MSVNSKMTTIANQIRSLLGVNGAIGLDAMANNLQDANDEVNEQTELIADIVNALNGKGVGGGSSIPSTIVAGDTPILASSKLAFTCNSTSVSASGISITIPKSGTYRFKASCFRTNTSGTYTVQLYKNGTAISGATASWNSYQGELIKDIQCNANDKIEIYCNSRGMNYRTFVSQLIACIDWDNGI